MKSINESLFNYLYESLGARYYQNTRKAELNLENSDNDNLEYLGTYFPRSFTEAHEMYINIFEDFHAYQSLDSKKEITILDLGSGTGGSLFGLIQAFCENFSDKKVKIISIDGNESALNIQRKIYCKLEQFIDKNDNDIIISFKKIEFENKDDINAKLDIVNPIDIMHSWKFVNEFYRNNYNINKGMYAEILNLADNILNESGILCLVDVTDRIRPGKFEENFLSVYFNNEVKDYFNNNTTNLVYILPYCCAINYSLCRKNNCFSRITFDVINYYENIDESKINYKLFIKGYLGHSILNDLKIDHSDGCKICYCLGERADNCAAECIEPYLLIN